MKRNDRLEDIVRKELDVRASDRTYDRLRDITLNTHGPSRTTASAATLSITRRTIMRNSITRLAAAAVVIAVISLGIFEFGGTGTKSGVVWAEVVQKVQTNPGVIYRTGRTSVGDPSDDWPNGYMVHYKSPLHSRTDWYRGGQIRRTVCFDVNAKTVLWLAYDHKVYAREPVKEETAQSVQSEQSTWMHPEDVISRFVSHDHRKLGAKTIDGVPCEGIETTDPAVYGANYHVKSVVGRLWVGVATGYPVRIEFEAAAGADGSLRQTGFADQFQWDVDFRPGDIEISIPPDFRPLD